MPKDLTYRLISAYGRADDLLEFASLTRDYKQMVTLYVQSEQLDKALETLKQVRVPRVEEASSSLAAHARACARRRLRPWRSCTTSFHPCS